METVRSLPQLFTENLKHQKIVILEENLSFCVAYVETLSTSNLVQLKKLCYIKTMLLENTKNIKKKNVGYF